MDTVEEKISDERKPHRYLLPKSFTTITPLSKFLALLLLVVLPFAGFYLGICYQKKVASVEIVTTPNLNNISTHPETAAITEAAPKQIGKYFGSYDVILKLNPKSTCDEYEQGACLRDVYLKDKVGGEEKFLLTVDNAVGDSRVPVYINGHLLIIKRTGNATYPSNSWTDELWVYTDNNQGYKQYDVKGLEFRVNRDASMVAIVPSATVDNGIMIAPLVDKGEAKTYEIDVNSCVPDPETRKWLGGLELEKWSDVNDSIWGNFSGEYGVDYCYWGLDAATSKVSYYPIPKGKNQTFLYFDPDRMEAQYTDKPFLGDAQLMDDWLKSHATYSVYKYSILTAKSTILKTFPSSSGFEGTIFPKQNW